MTDRVRLLKELEGDDAFRQEVFSVLIKDKNFLVEMATRVMGVSLLEMGVNYPGTLGEFIYNDIKRGKKTG